MDIIVDRPQLVRIVLLYLNNNFGDLTPKKHKDHPKLVFYVNSDNGVMMEYDKENGGVYIHYEHIWSKIESLFHLNSRETQSIMKVWLEEAYKLGGVTPFFSDEFDWFTLEEAYKLSNLKQIFRQADLM
jgi:hypothetical protein